MTNARVVVFGGANLDIAAVSRQDIVPADSNPSQIYFTPGGVGRNIAENIARLGLPAALVTAVGHGPFSDSILHGCQELGIDCGQVYRSDNGKGCYYLSIHSPGGELALGASDMEAIEDLPYEHTAAALAAYGDMALCVVDANLSEDRLGQIVHSVPCPVIADPVSAGKAPRLRSYLGKLHTLKANFLELSAIAGEDLHNLDDVARVCARLLEQGPQQIYVTMGADGVYYFAKNGSGMLPSPPMEVRSVTGAGDAFVAGLAYGLLQQMDLKDMARCGSAMARLTLTSDHSVDPNMTLSAMLEEMGKLGQGQD